MRLAILSFALTSCAVFSPSVAFRTHNIKHCFRTDHGISIHVMQGMDCPNKDEIEFNERMWRDLLKVKPHELSRYDVVFTPGRIIGCGKERPAVVGCSDPQVAYVDTEYGWQETMLTLMEELSHRLCFSRYGTMDAEHQKPCYLKTERLQVWPGPLGTWHSH